MGGCMKDYMHACEYMFSLSVCVCVCVCVCLCVCLCVRARLHVFLHVVCMSFEL